MRIKMNNHATQRINERGIERDVVVEACNARLSIKKRGRVAIHMTAHKCVFIFDGVSLKTVFRVGTKRNAKNDANQHGRCKFVEIN